MDRDRRDRERARRERLRLRRLRLARRAAGTLLAAALVLLAVRFTASFSMRTFGRDNGVSAVTVDGSASRSRAGLENEAGYGADAKVGYAEMEIGAGEVTEEQVKSGLEQLQQEFPDGMYWNHMGLEEGSPSTVTDTPCDHSAYGEDFCNSYDGATGELFPQYRPSIQCLGFASLISDRLFGVDAPVTVHRSFDRLRLGDQIRLTSDMHSMVVIEKGEDWVRVAECNADYNSCRIGWGRSLSRGELEEYGEELEYITRWPEE